MEKNIIEGLNENDILELYEEIVMIPENISAGTCHCFCKDGYNHYYYCGAGNFSDRIPGYIYYGSSQCDGYYCPSHGGYVKLVYP